MAQEKILDITKSAADNETAVNNKFDELSNQQTTPSAGGISNLTVGGNQVDVADYDTFEVDLSLFNWLQNRKLVVSGSNAVGQQAEGFSYNSGSAFALNVYAGDVLITNADTDGVLFCRSGNPITPLLLGRGEYDGKYVIHVVKSDCSLVLSYKVNVGYDVHFFIKRVGCISVPFEIDNGRKFKDYVGYAVADTAYALTAPITVAGAEGRFLYMPNALNRSYGLYTKYKAGAPEDPENETSEDVEYFLSSHFWNTENPNLIVPITENSATYRFEINKSRATRERLYLVTKEWLLRHNLCTAWAGKKWLMYGDSYVYGHNIGSQNTWYNRFAAGHAAIIYNKGHNGLGLVSSGNYAAESLLSLLTIDMLDGNGEPLDLDIIGICCGRNDYSNGVPIGDIDDMITDVGDSPNLPSYTGDVTFMGGLNYLCDWLLDHYAGKRIFFVTPWYFLNDNPTGNAIEPQYKYVDAVMEVAGKWGIPCFDAARQSGISVQHEGFRTKYFLSSTDTSHLNANGHILMSNGPVAAWLENLFRE